MSCNVQLVDVSKRNRHLARKHQAVPAATQTNAGKQTFTSVDCHEGESSGSYRPCSPEEDDCGKRVALIQLDVSRLSDGVGPSFIAFSSDAKRCIVCSGGCLSVWETTRFSQLCNRMVSRGQEVVNISFCADSSSRFIVFFADLSMSVFRIELNDEWNHSFVLRESERWANPVFSDDWDLSNARKVALVSDDDMRRTFAHLAEMPEQGLVLSVLSDEERAWEALPFAEYFGSDFAYSYADFGNDSRLVFGNRRLPSGKEPCIVLFHRIRRQRSDWNVSSLDGSSGRMDRDGTFVLTWDGVGSNVKEAAHRVYIYRTASDSTSDPGQMVSTGDCPKTKDPFISIVLEKHDALVGGILIDARMLLTSGSRLLSANDVQHSAKMLLFYGRNRGETATVFCMDLKNETIEFQLETQMPWFSIASTSVTRFLDNGNVAIAQEEQKIFVCDSDGRHGVVHDLRDGRMIYRVPLSSQDRIRVVKAEFDPTGQFVAVDNGTAIEVFRVSSPIELRGGRECAEETTEAMMSALWRMEEYDSVAFGQLMAEGFALKRQITAEVAPLAEARVFTGHRSILSDYEGSNVTHVILSPDRQSVAVVLREGRCKICIYRTKEIQGFDGFSDDTQWRMVTTAEVTPPRSSYDASFGIFCSANGQTEFAFASPQHDGILIARVRFERPEDLVTHWIESSIGLPLKGMKATADGAKAIVVFEDGEFAVLDLKDGFRTVNRGHLHYPCGVEYFVESLIEAFPIHLSTDSATLTVGLDPLKKKPVSFRLNSSREDMTAEYTSNVPRLLRLDVEAILWMNREQTRAIVGFGASDRLVIYDISQTPAKELHDTSGSSPEQILDLHTEFRARLESRRDRDVLSETNRLSMVCMHFLLDLQHSVPDAALIDLLGIEIDADTVKRLISEHGCSVLGYGRKGRKNLFHHAAISKRFDCADLLLDLAAEEGKSLTLCWEDGDLLGWSIVRKSKEVAAFVMEVLAEKRTTVSETAAILSVHTDKLLEVFPQLLHDYLVEDKLLYDYGRFPVPASLLKNWKEKPVAMVTDPMDDWTATNSEEVKSLWLSHCKALKKSVRRGEEEVQIMAVSKFFFLEDIVYRGKGCFLANLMKKGVSVEIFGSTFVKSLVQWRWHSSLRNAFLISAMLHVIATILFSVCVVEVLVYHGHGCDLWKLEDDPIKHYKPYECSSGVIRRYLAIICVFIIFYLGIFGVIPQIRILSFFIEPLVLFEIMVWGDQYPVKSQSALAALACMSCWISIVLYLQPLSATGPLVSMIRQVFLDIMPFALLAALSIVGFGLTFMILFSKTFEVNDKSYFSTVFKSFETLFHASLGQFDPEILEDDDDFSHVFRSLFFGAFLFVCGIVMLSFLVAILGDTYDKIKFIERAEIIKCRAKLIVVGNGWNGIPGKIWKACLRMMWRSKSPDPVPQYPVNMRHASDVLVKPRRKCFHILVPVEPIDSETVVSWQGKILEVVKKFRSELKKNEERLIEQMSTTQREVAEQMSTTQREVAELRKEITKLREKLSSQTS